MRLYQVVLRSGTSVNILAKAIVDDPAISEDLLFFQDEARRHLAAVIKRNQVAGLILHLQKSSANPSQK